MLILSLHFVGSAGFFVCVVVGELQNSQCAKKKLGKISAKQIFVVSTSLSLNCQLNIYHIESE